MVGQHAAVTTTWLKRVGLTRLQPEQFFCQGSGVSDIVMHMQNNITDADTLGTLHVKLAARQVVLMRLVKSNGLWRALGSRTDVLCPAVAYAECPAVAVRRLADTLAPVATV